MMLAVAVVGVIGGELRAVGPFIGWKLAAIALDTQCYARGTSALRLWLRYHARTKKRFEREDSCE